MPRQVTTTGFDLATLREALSFAPGSIVDADDYENGCRVIFVSFAKGPDDLSAGAPHFCIEYLDGAFEARDWRDHRNTLLVRSPNMSAIIGALQIELGAREKVRAV